MVPGTRPTSAQPVPRTSIGVRSRITTIKVTSVASMISVPGIRLGSISATTGAASIPMPKPIEACRHDASRTAIATTV